MTKSPKARFQENKEFVSQWPSVVNSRLFEEASDAAMLQFISDNPLSSEAAASYYAIQGALKFLKNLQTLADIPEPPARKTTSELHHETKL